MSKLGGKAMSENTDADEITAGVVETVVAGTNIDNIDSTDPANPIVNASAGSDPLTTKGDLVAFDTATKRLPVGSDDQVLTADSTAAEGIAWKAGGGGSAALVSASVELTTDVTGRGTAATAIIWETEIHDDDNFIDIAGAPTELTVPTGITRVSISAYFNGTLLGNGTSLSMFISRFNSADVFQETVGQFSASAGSDLQATATASAVGVACVAGDYFTVRHASTDSSWTLTTARAFIQGG